MRGFARTKPSEEQPQPYNDSKARSLTLTRCRSFVSTRAPTTLLLAKEVKKVRVLNKKEEVTKCRFIEVEFKDNQSPLPNGELKHIGCLITDEILQGLIRKSFGSDRLKSSGRGGRGRGRGERGGGRGGRGGRGKREPRDPKMSFSEF